jgi:hypothetical protein
MKLTDGFPTKKKGVKKEIESLLLRFLLRSSDFRLHIQTILILKSITSTRSPVRSFARLRDSNWPFR